MANVKITDLTELAAVDLATNDVLPIVDINNDSTKKVTIASLDTRSASNDFITFTRLNANINVVQDNVASVTVGTAADTETRLNANLDVVQDNVAAVETRRTNNIAGAISTVLTTNLTASRALISGSGGKIEVSPVSSTELGYVDGVTGAIQTQIDALEARRAANNITTTFTDDVVITGNLTINGDTTTVSTTNLDVEDRMIMLADGVSGSPSADVGLLFNRGNQGNAAFFYDESGKTFKLSDTKDPKSNTSLSPVTASNLSVGIVDAATVKFNGTSVQDAISANVTTLTNEDTALQARITANATITTAVEARRVANIAGAISTVTTSDLTADRVMITNGSGKIAASSGVTPTELGYLDGLTLGTVAASKAVTADSNGDVNFIREVDIDGNVVIGTNDSNTVTIVGKLDLGAFS